MHNSNNLNVIKSNGNSYECNTQPLRNTKSQPMWYTICYYRTTAADRWCTAITLNCSCDDELNGFSEFPLHTEYGRIGAYVGRPFQIAILLLYLIPLELPDATDQASICRKTTNIHIRNARKFVIHATYVDRYIDPDAI